MECSLHRECQQTGSQSQHFRRKLNWLFLFELVYLKQHKTSLLCYSCIKHPYYVRLTERIHAFTQSLFIEKHSITNNDKRQPIVIGYNNISTAVWSCTQCNNCHAYNQSCTSQHQDYANEYQNSSTIIQTRSLKLMMEWMDKDKAVIHPLCVNNKGFRYLVVPYD